MLGLVRTARLCQSIRPFPSLYGIPKMLRQSSSSTGETCTGPTVKDSNGDEWCVTVGLEVHAQILAESKLFSSAPGAGSPLNQLGTGAPNTCVALFDAALPGSLPTVNRHCVVQAVRAALMLHSEPQQESIFERKHYFYADLPSGYQITQTRKPIAEGGRVLVDISAAEPSKGKKKKNKKNKAPDQALTSVPDETEQVIVGLDRIQLEQDSGKSTHTLLPTASLVDLNRAGTALLEIVTLPDIPSATVAGAFLKKLQSILRHGGVCDGNMELGSMRCDVNVSLRRAGTSTLGERVEMKNLNSIRAVTRAVEHETERQLGLILAADGDSGVIEQETRSFDLATGRSARLRGKEDAPDYRFMPEPDLLPLRVGTDLLHTAQSSLPEDLDQVKARLMRPPLSLSRYDATVLVGEPGASRFFDEALAAASLQQADAAKLSDEDDATTAALAKQVTNWLTTEVLGRLSDAGIGLVDLSGGAGGAGGIAFTEQQADALAGATDRIVAKQADSEQWWSSGCPISPTMLGHVAGMTQTGAISGATGKMVVGLLFGEVKRGEKADAELVQATRTRSVADTVDALDVRQISDVATVTKWCEEAVSLPQAQQALDKLRQGRERAMGALVGLALNVSQGKANPSVIARIMPQVTAPLITQAEQQERH